jgi:hypothetical protein
VHVAVVVDVGHLCHHLALDDEANNRDCQIRAYLDPTRAIPRSEMPHQQSPDDQDEDPAVRSAGDIEVMIPARQRTEDLLEAADHGEDEADRRQAAPVDQPAAAV